MLLFSLPLHVTQSRVCDAASMLLQDNTGVVATGMVVFSQWRLVKTALGQKRLISLYVWLQQKLVHSVSDFSTVWPIHDLSAIQ